MQFDVGLLGLTYQYIALILSAQQKQIVKNTYHCGMEFFYLAIKFIKYLEFFVHIREYFELVLAQVSLKKGKRKKL